MGSIPCLTLRRHQGVWLAQGRSARVDMAHLAELSRAIHDWHICRPSNQRCRAKIELHELTIDAHVESITFMNLRAELMPEERKWELMATFANAPRPESKAVPPVNRFSLVRNHDPHLSATEIQLRIQSKIPLWLLSPFTKMDLRTSAWALDEAFRAGGHFTGVAEVRFHADGNSIHLTDATIEDFDVALLWGRGPAMISGKVQMLLNQFKMDSEGLQWAEGCIEVGPGRVNGPLFHALAHFLQCETARRNPTETLAFDRLVARFRIRPEWIQCIGGLPDGTLLQDAHGFLARRNDPSALPLSNVIHALSAARSDPTLIRAALVWLPLEDSQRRETAQLLRLGRN